MVVNRVLALLDLLTYMCGVDQLADTIRQARRRRGWTQDQLASAIGVSRSAVAQWETGRSGQLTANLARISLALDIDLGKLVAATENSTNSFKLTRRLRESPIADGDRFLGDELALLRLYRMCGPEDQNLIVMTARRLSRKSE